MRYSVPILILLYLCYKVRPIFLILAIYQFSRIIDLSQCILYVTSKQNGLRRVQTSPSLLIKARGIDRKTNVFPKEYLTSENIIFNKQNYFYNIIFVCL